MVHTRRAWLGTAAALAVPARAAAQAGTADADAVVHRVAVGESLAEVLARAAEGSVVELAEGVHRGQAATVRQRQLTIRGSGAGAVLRADGAHAEGKASIVVREGDIRIENLEFRGARVPDGNGAGIRFERGRLLVQNCRFHDNQNGILTANFGDAELRVADCEFAQAPEHTLLPHLLYVGRIARLMVERSRFSGGRAGHLLKSRAAVNELRANGFDDGAAGEAAYEVEFPEGGAALLEDNLLVQSPHTRNRTLLAFGAEADRVPRERQHRHRLELRRNRFVNRYPLPANFVQIHDARLATPPVVVAEANRFVGLGAIDPRLVRSPSGTNS
jgi:hypothetical protein